jgi:hypothetical protein
MQKIQGQTLLSKAIEVVTNCTKMMAIVLSAKSPYKEGTFPFGTNYDDYASWFLSEFFEVWKIAEWKKAKASNDIQKVVPETMPPGWMFKGFIAGCLNQSHQKTSFSFVSVHGEVHCCCSSSCFGVNDQ